MKGLFMILDDILRFLTMPIIFGIPLWFIVLIIVLWYFLSRIRKGRF